MEENPHLNFFLFCIFGGIFRGGHPAENLVGSCWSFFTIFPREIFGIFHEFFPIIEILSSQISPERVFRFRVIHQGNEGLNHCKRMFFFTTHRSLIPGKISSRQSHIDSYQFLTLFFFMRLYLDQFSWLASSFLH